MIVDSHVHCSEPDSAERPQDPSAPRTYGAASVESVAADAAAIGIDKVVQTTPMRMRWDNSYGLEGAARNPDSVLGVFGRFDAFAPDLENRLEACVAAPGMLGIRVQPTSGDWLAQRRLDPLLRVAERLGVRVKFYAKNQPREMRDTARRFPGLRVIVEHLTLVPADPSAGDADPFARWSDVLDLTCEPNVWSQVSLLPEVAPRGEAFPFPTVRLRVRELYERAGSSRLIWGSHYPAILNACSYLESLEFLRGCEFLNAKDKAGIFGENLLRYLGADASS